MNPSQATPASLPYSSPVLGRYDKSSRLCPSEQSVDVVIVETTSRIGPNHEAVTLVGQGIRVSTTYLVIDPRERSVTDERQDGHDTGTVVTIGVVPRGTDDPNHGPRLLT